MNIFLISLIFSVVKGGCPPPSLDCDSCILSMCWWVKTTTGYNCSAPPFGEGVIPLVPPQGRCPDPKTTTTQAPFTTSTTTFKPTTSPPGPPPPPPAVGQVGFVFLVVTGIILLICVILVAFILWCKRRNPHSLLFQFRRNQNLSGESGTTDTTVLPSSRSSSEDPPSSFNPQTHSTPMANPAFSSSSSSRGEEEESTTVDVSVDVHNPENSDEEEITLDDDNANIDDGNGRDPPTLNLPENPPGMARRSRQMPQIQRMDNSEN